MAASTMLEKHKSKRPCPCCDEKKLLTNDNEKFDDVMSHLCLSCGYEFSDNKQLREYRDSEKKDEDKSPWNEGFLVLVTMLVVILVLRLSRQNNFGDPVMPQAQMNPPTMGQ